jgi:8-oxo-dGTP pyrophosphatase MutT (NUDIX family)
LVPEPYLKPDTPPKHLVSYFVLYDESTHKLMLVDHIKAKTWLPAGGHVKLDEDPRITVTREADEELGIVANSILSMAIIRSSLQPEPLKDTVAILMLACG